MGPIGVPEMLFILAIALLIFGPKRLPELGRTIGKALGEFRRATTDLKRSIDVEINASDPPSRPAPAAPSVPRSPIAQAAAEDDAAEDEDAPADAADDEETPADAAEPVAAVSDDAKDTPPA